ncbi:MAG: hypothetical protein GY909_16175 [Oligoflexia bacterium]|nr:hypothetical protein [Oligoflexia bacterium]
MATQENKKLKDLLAEACYLISVPMLIVLVLFAVFSPTVYDCSEVKSEVLSQSLKTCFEKESYAQKMDLEVSKLEEEMKYKEEVELHKTCRVALEKGIKECSDFFDKSSFKSEISNQSSCSEEVKKALCEPKMFLWKLWYF